MPEVGGCMPELVLFFPGPDFSIEPILRWSSSSRVSQSARLFFISVSSYSVALRFFNFLRSVFLSECVISSPARDAMFFIKLLNFLQVPVWQTKLKLCSNLSLFLMELDEVVQFHWSFFNADNEDLPT